MSNANVDADVECCPQALQMLVRLSAMAPSVAEEEICKTSAEWLPAPRGTSTKPVSLLNSGSLASWAIWSQSFLDKTQEQQQMILDATAWRIRGARVRAADRAWRLYKKRKNNGSWRTLVALKVLQCVRLQFESEGLVTDV